MRLENINFQMMQHIPVTNHINESTAKVRDTNQNVSHNKEQMETMVYKLNEFIEPLRTNLKFQLHERLNEYYVEVVNPMTDEVIKEIPPKKMLDMYADMAELMGLIIDQKV